MNNLVFEGKEGSDDVMIPLTKSGPIAVVAVSVFVAVSGGSATGLHLCIIYVCVCVCVFVVDSDGSATGLHLCIIYVCVCMCLMWCYIASHVKKKTVYFSCCKSCLLLTINLIICGVPTCGLAKERWVNSILGV